MTSNPRIPLDGTDRAILALLLEDGRTTTADLARGVGLSPSATADRVRRLTDAGVIGGYTAVVEPAALGHDVTAYIRLRFGPGRTAAFHEYLAGVPQVLEAHHVTGEDCYLIKVVAGSMDHLEQLASGLATYGHITTNVVFSSPVKPRPLSPGLQPADA
ncbi:Lrp/AsnC family transcriptional regulator [Tsukamurella paurometabola]|uniref:HTH-type transcriptional regulator lrpC n=1 Tax=Tsukamurella paurometabola TaxID=2061 RepID=A0A3P8K6T4_TSUPA|nr:Lrp/AsnC family transcriptional regulator [Tsukamurella paurometabola]MBS4100913.1 Lrp/AsnC family transcriptional regulator [Tsukamurella paurometabola]UEA83383.1 Lrp/AsnC family transcriptional regulator [Tsukamurella paurometabola]VDR40494.1 HTH-type transcriptional regulator lrpC [Tsukamurella paurometabola]